MRSWREQEGLPATRLAGLLGVHRVDLYKMERGERTPNTGHLLALVNLGADAQWLLTGRR